MSSPAAYYTGTYSPKHLALIQLGEPRGSSNRIEKRTILLQTHRKGDSRGHHTAHHADWRPRGPPSRHRRCGRPYGQRPLGHFFSRLRSPSHRAVITRLLYPAFCFYILLLTHHFFFGPLLCSLGSRQRRRWRVRMRRAARDKQRTQRRLRLSRLPLTTPAPSFPTRRPWLRNRFAWRHSAQSPSNPPPTSEAYSMRICLASRGRTPRRPRTIDSD